MKSIHSTILDNKQGRPLKSKIVICLFGINFWKQKLWIFHNSMKNCWNKNFLNFWSIKLSSQKFWKVIKCFWVSKYFRNLKKLKKIIGIRNHQIFWDRDLKIYVSSVKSGKNSWTINFAHYSFNQAGDQA